MGNFIETELIKRALNKNFVSYFGLMTSVSEHCYVLWMADLQKRLREKYNCHIQITHEAYVEGINYNVQVLFYALNAHDCWDDLSSGVYGDNGEFATYEKALEFGLNEALKRLDEVRIIGNNISL